MGNQYLILIEQLVRDGHSENEIDRIVGDLVDEDAETREDEPQPLAA